MKVSNSARRGAPLGQVSDMDVRLLRVFKAVVECGGMSAAELELNIGTSTVSRHVKDLETRLGFVLCRRGRAGFSLTTEGQRIYEETLRLLASMDAFRSSVDTLHGRLGGTLDLALFDKTATNPAARIAQAIALYRDLAPDVALNVHVAPLPAIERGIMDGTYQVGVIPHHRASRSLDYRDLFGESMLLYCGDAHPLFRAADRELTWKRLRTYAFAGLGFHSPNMQLTHRARLIRAATGYDQEGIATLVLSGRFLGFLPQHYAASFEAGGLVRALAPTKFRYQCRFVGLWRRSPQPSRAAALFVDCLSQAHGSA
jgi:DNA-binding transcriptional LysR family regulator